MSSYPRIVAWQPLEEVYLIDLGDKTAIQADLRDGVRWHPRWMTSLTSRGAWFDHVDDPELRAKLMALPYDRSSRPMPIGPEPKSTPLFS